MLIPRFTLRKLLLLVTISSIFFLIVRLALGGSAWAAAVALAVASVLLAFLTYGALFVLAYALFWLLAALRRHRAGGSPFAPAAVPPQLVPPDGSVAD